jgi:hypothetical protein
MHDYCIFEYGSFELINMNANYLFQKSRYTNSLDYSCAREYEKNVLIKSPVAHVLYVN